MLFLILMILTGMLVKGVIILGARMSAKIEGQLAKKGVEALSVSKIKSIPSTDIDTSRSLKNLSPIGS